MGNVAPRNKRCPSYPFTPQDPPKLSPPSQGHYLAHQLRRGPREGRANLLLTRVKSIDSSLP